MKIRYWSALALACVLAVSPSATGAQSSADYQALRKEMDLLRDRLTALQKEIDALKSARAVASQPLPPSTPSLPITPVDIVLNLSKAAMRGSLAAPITIAEVSDFECPFCGRFARDTEPALVKQYVDSGKVRWAFVHLPLPIHQLAFKAAEAAACAGDQGKFWEMHALLFAQQGSALAPALLPQKGTVLGLNQSAYTGCLDSAKHAPEVQAHIDMMRPFRITGTPTFFIGTLDAKTGVLQAKRRIIGAKPLAVFQQAFDELLQGK